MKNSTHYLYLILLLFFPLFLKGQSALPCEKVIPFLEAMEKKIDKINTTDPDLIPLHYYFVKDINKELKVFNDQTIPNLKHCPGINYYETVSLFDRLVYQANKKSEKLDFLNTRVDSLYYEKALLEKLYDNEDNAMYYLNRSLQYNRVYPNSLLMKCSLYFEEGKYQDCIDVLQILYHEAPLQREHEIRISDFNMFFYEKLYSTADSLVKIEKAAEALDLFQILEKFCRKMPSDYCNDDYYHGILRSKRGVYESYLLIANVAKDRGNSEIAEKFVQYAEEYRHENEAEILEKEQYEHLLWAESVVAEKQSDEQTVDSEIFSNPFQGTVFIDTTKEVVEVVKVVKTIEIVERIEVIEEPVEESKEYIKENEPIMSETVDEIAPKTVEVTENVMMQEKESPVIVEEKEIYPEVAKEEETPMLQEQQQGEDAVQKEILYNRYLVEALNYCLESEYNKAYSAIKQAKELEDCKCFAIDSRVDMLYKALNKEK